MAKQIGLSYDAALLHVATQFANLRFPFPAHDCHS
jgi:hypothetical protein